jgi:predicted nucleotidyltransferase
MGKMPMPRSLNKNSLRGKEKSYTLMADVFLLIGENSMGTSATKVNGRPAPRKAIRKQLTLGHIQRMLRESFPELQKRYHVRSLGIFGSYVHEEQKRRSDLDILVEFDRAPSLFEFVRLERRLSEQVGIKVDLVMKTALKPNIGRRILEEVVPV